MGVRLRISRQTLALLEALLVHPAQWHHGYALSQQTGLASGTLYPILMRLEKSGWLETRWEDVPVSGRPPRHFYRLSGYGREWAREELGAARESKFWKPAHSKV
ncbi:MAG TPA: PadR family transcriptional regulator [Candidatus Bathyarchaeia archaeon]|nr:PadR family transcriptional regulator [Candidatus Bathyarchaeia archaeon]